MHDVLRDDGHFDGVLEEIVAVHVQIVVFRSAFVTVQPTMGAEKSDSRE